MSDIHQKIQKIRVELEKMKLKKTGKGDGFSYYQLSDFVPQLNEILLREKLITMFSMDDKEAWLNVSGDGGTVRFSVDKAEASLPDLDVIQNKGATITYLRRYLMVMAFDIVESDPVDMIKKIELSKEEVEAIEAIQTLADLHEYILTLKKALGVKYQRVILAAYNKRKSEIENNIIKK